MDPRLEDELMKKYYPEMYRARTEGQTEIDDARSMQKYTNMAPGIGQVIGSITAPKYNSLPFVGGWGDSMAKSAPAQIRPTQIDFSAIKNAGDERLKRAESDRDKGMEEGLAVDQLGLKAQDMHDETDPENPRAIMMRDSVKAALPELAAKIPNYEKMTLKDFKTSFPVAYKSYMDYAELSSKNTTERRKEAKEEKKSGHDRYKRSVDIRKELSNNPSFKNARETDGRLSQVDELMKNPGGVSDEAILVMYQKALDPGSVVREGEFARTAEGQALLSRVDTIMQSYMKGNRMTPELRNQVVGTMRALRDGNRVQLQKILVPYEREIRDYQLDRGIILGEDEEGGGGNAGPSPAGAGSRPSGSPPPKKGGKFDGRTLP